LWEKTVSTESEVTTKTLRTLNKASSNKYCDSFVAQFLQNDDGRRMLKF